MTEAPPPWIVFPEMRATDPATQGAEEAYIDLEWLPFWQTLHAEARRRYLDRWNATAEWRDVITERYDPEGFDVEEDARASAAWRQAQKSNGDPA